MYNIVIATLQQSLFFLPLTLGVYLSYRILAVTDLTVDGTFVLGAATFASLVTHGINQYVSIILAVFAGVIIGALVALVQKLVKINSLIAGILATFMLYSVNFRVMGKPNISLLDSSVFLQNLQTSSPEYLLFVIVLFTLILFGVMCYFLRSKIGILLRAYGSNTRLIHAMGKSTILLLMLGLGVSNGLAALCGVINAQIDGYADLNMGLGMALTAIGSVVIGRHLTNRIFYRREKFSALVDCCSCLLGTSLYFFAMNFFLACGINPIYLKLFLGAVLIVFLGSARYSHRGEVYA
ncbi:MAG: ABC transporter permease [Gammaproteobacteria bacterium]|jgi:putative ABC transport system permease protein